VIGVALLAAGRSTRMGRPKLLLPWGRTSVLGQLLLHWEEEGARQVAVILAAGDAAIVEELHRLKFNAQNCITNPKPERGMFSSIQCAARWCGWKPELTHWVIALGDQPHLRSRTLRAVLDLARAEPEKVCQPGFEGRARHPVLLPKSIFLRLKKSKAATLKKFLSRFPLATCEVNDPGLALDIDYPEDYQRALRLAQVCR
jgi:molybdenum cofactor cytidylyltransferase